METPEQDLTNNQPKEDNQSTIHHPDAPDKSPKPTPAPQLEIFPDGAALRWATLYCQEANRHRPGKSYYYENF